MTLAKGLSLSIPKLNPKPRPQLGGWGGCNSKSSNHPPTKPVNHQDEFKYCTKQQNSQKESCLFNQAGPIIAFEQILASNRLKLHIVIYVILYCYTWLKMYCIARRWPIEIDTKTQIWGQYSSECTIIRFESIYFALRLGKVLRKNQNMSLKSFSGPVHAEKIRFAAYAGSCLLTYCWSCWPPSLP